MIKKYFLSGGWQMPDPFTAMLFGAPAFYVAVKEFSTWFQKEFERDIKLGKGVNFIKMPFSDFGYNITPKDRRNTKVLVKHAVRVKVKTAVEYYEDGALPRGVSFIMVDKEGRVYQGKLAAEKRRGILRSKTIVKIKTSPKGGRPVIRNIKDIDELYLRVTKRYEDLADELKSDKKYYAIVGARKNGVFTFKIRKP
ncbi:hypothetical protein E3E31_11875 [Thermococcus sp. M39]|uniref:hypothetical protein n=1 Tax=unclassified Thermococcus TaxID=2627626 RepID=UPI0014393217|nr:MULTISPECIES: hypothetical protein [unclassified Thermococcus]NJE09205.1 hypothetical protein [Thermococcus sp. M39]NJE11992.1 hypothetical protein [Thermococcus sp. LS2]